MRKYLTVYKGDRRAFSASTHVVARRLANAAYRAETWEEPETSAIVVIDVEASGYSAFDAAWQVLVCDNTIKVDQSVEGIDEMLRNRGVEPPTRFDGEAGTYSDPKCYACKPAISDRHAAFIMGHSVSPAPLSESVWAKLQQEDLDKVFDIHSRRAGDRK